MPRLFVVESRRSDVAAAAGRDQTLATRIGPGRGLYGSNLRPGEKGGGVWIGGGGGVGVSWSTLDTPSGVDDVHFFFCLFVFFAL